MQRVTVDPLSLLKIYLHLKCEHPVSYIETTLENVWFMKLKMIFSQLIPQNCDHNDHIQALSIIIDIKRRPIIIFHSNRYYDFWQLKKVVFFCAVVRSESILFVSKCLFEVLDPLFVRFKSFKSSRGLCVHFHIGLMVHACISIYLSVIISTIDLLLAIYKGVKIRRCFHYRPVATLFIVFFFCFLDQESCLIIFFG